ncbi:MAG: hypothetical protein NTW86_21070 [Candidatus Sumerlaeota bacterium]|nr:hypothetical protein [Candidatus Sumerlaeota bacterium]
MTNRVLQLGGAWLFLLPALAFGFNGNVAGEGPLKVTIEAIETVMQLDAPRDVSVALENTGEKPLSVDVKLADLTAEWRVVGKAEQAAKVAPGAKAEAKFQIAAGRAALSALYPVHVYASFQSDSGPVTVHAVQVFQTDFAEVEEARSAPTELPANVVPSGGALALATLKTQRVVWNYVDQPPVQEPVGWQGSDKQSSAAFQRGPVKRGEERQALAMHPPYKGGKGSVFAEYRVRLPDTRPIRLTFFNAIRDNGPTEPPSDGVTFRVWANGEKLFELHTLAKTWTPGEADLSPFAGREILLRLENHPGPKLNTVCDSGYWGDPTIVAGEPPKQLTETERKEAAKRAAEAVAAGGPDQKGLFVFDLSEGNRAAVAVGPNGLADSAIAFGAGEKQVVFQGLRMAILDQPVGAWPSSLTVRNVDAKRDASGHVKVIHHLAMGEEAFDLTADLWAEGCGLRAKVECPQRITDLSLGPADQTAPRVYFAHGYCIADPKAFRVNGGGQGLSTSHVGFDFEKGVSLLAACDNPQDSLEVDPAQRLYALHVHHNSMLTFVPGLKGAFDCAIRYRPLYDKQPAGGVQRMAGRFVFDIWGGRYAEIADEMKKALTYGLKDSMLLIHSWQRWGYDYRLPDVWPPNPQFGTLEEMQDISRICAAADVPWGLHDNYIDFYPDASGFSYDHITFNEQGEPKKAWINIGRDAQSYQWRPDQILPFVQRNLKLIKDSVHPTAYFLDVFSASGTFDYYDRDGKFHGKPETRQCWGDVFAWIRDYLDANAPTSSEAGGDHLIGWLDGADCQFPQLGDEPHQHVIRLSCADWDRVPWFDAVNHARFILHGVGYSIRYQGGRSRVLHGIESDDYISAELLTGHALMIDRNSGLRGAARKYWLAQDLIRSLALDEITNVEFEGGDFHRVMVSWKSGARVFVNRGKEDWTVDGHVLPQYGYAARNGDIASSIERLDGVIAEQSCTKSALYANGRGQDADAPLAIRPLLDRVEYLGDHKLKVYVNWDVEQSVPADYYVSVQVYEPDVTRMRHYGFQGGGAPTPPTSQWKGRVTTGDAWILTIPENCAAGKYEVFVALTDPKTKKRARMLGEEDDNTRYRIGALRLEGSKTDIAGVRVESAEVGPAEPSRMNAARTMVDFGVAATAGAFRCVIEPKRLVVTPLPDSEAFTVALRLDELTGKPATAQSVDAVDADGKKIRSVEYKANRPIIRFETQKGEFAYQVNLQ